MPAFDYCQCGSPWRKITGITGTLELQHFQLCASRAHVVGRGELIHFWRVGANRVYFSQNLQGHIPFPSVTCLPQYMHTRRYHMPSLHLDVRIFRNTGQVPSDPPSDLTTFKQHCREAVLAYVPVRQTQPFVVGLRASPA